MNNSILKIANLSKIYSSGTKSETQALKDVSFSLNDSEITGLIGSNGAGKTTLIRIIMGFETPDSGTVEFLGTSTLDLEVRNLIGYQSDLQFRSKRFNLYNYLTFIGKIKGLDNPSSRIDDLLVSFNLKDAKYKNLTALSKGMRQKVELISTFLNKPKLVVLDEPTAALDPPSVFELRDFLTEYKKSGSTILFSSHHLTEVEKVSDRVIFIDHGKLLDDIVTAKSEPGILEEKFRQFETKRGLN